MEPESHENILNAVNAVSAASNALAAVGGLGAGALAVAMDEGIAAVGGDSVVRLEMVLVMQTTLGCKIAATGNLCRTCSFHSNHSYCSWFSAIATVLIVACLLLHKLELRPKHAQTAGIFADGSSLGDVTFQDEMGNGLEGNAQ